METEIQKILKALHTHPVNVPVCKSNIGSGAFAYPVGIDSTKYKPIVKGNIPSDVKDTLRMLFFGLAIDLGVEIDEAKLGREVYGDMNPCPECGEHIESMEYDGEVAVPCGHVLL